MFIGWQGIVMDYLCAKFGDFAFSRFGFIVRTHTHRHKQTRTPLIALITRMSSAWVKTTAPATGTRRTHSKSRTQTAIYSRPPVVNLLPSTFKNLLNISVFLVLQYVATVGVWQWHWHVTAPYKLSYYYYLLLILMHVQSVVGRNGGLNQVKEICFKCRLEVGRFWHNRTSARG